MMRLFVWIDGRVTFRLGLPINFANPERALLLPVGCRKNENSAITIARQFALLAGNRSNDGRIHREDWFDVAVSLDLSEDLTMALFTVAKRSHKELMVPVSSLAIAILLLGVEEFARNLEEYQIETPFAERNRSTMIFEFIRENLVEILRILSITAGGNEEIDTFQQPFTKSLAFLDCFFEGLIDKDHEPGDRSVSHVLDIPIPFSQLATEAWSNDKLLTLEELTNRIRSCLCADPFAIDDVTIEPPIPSTAPSKRTSLGAGGRRKVFVIDWNRIEILRRGVYRDAHLRLVNTRKGPISRLVQPWRSKTVLIDGLSQCQSVVLGPVSGTAYLKNIHDSAITVACNQLIIQDCSKLEVYCLTNKPPIIRNSQNVYLGPYNTYYTGILTEFANGGFEFAHNEVQRTPILLDEQSSFAFIPANDFYVEPVPIEQDEDSLEAQEFFSHLPPRFEASWMENFEKLRILCDKCSRQPVISTRDEKYLLAKVESPSENGVPKE